MRTTPPLLALALFAFVLGQTSSGKAQSQPSRDASTGTLCVLPNSPEPPTRFSPGGEYNPATLTVHIDKRDPIPWPHKQPVRIKDLSLSERHLIVLTSDDKRIQSSWFHFADYKDSELCMYFDGYGGIQLGDKHDALWCKCK